MTGPQDDATQQAAAPAQAPATLGGILATERERQGLGRGDIAQRLHMSVSQVEALEGGDYGKLPRGTFLRGFTRNYARALGLDPEPLVGMLAEDAPHESAPRIVVPSQNIRFDPLGERLANPYVKAAGIAAAVIVFGFAAMYWWVFIRPQPTTVVVEKSKLEAPAPVPTAPKIGAPSGEAAPGPATAADGSAAAGGSAAPADATPVVTAAATPVSAPATTGASSAPAAAAPSATAAAPAKAPATTGSAPVAASTAATGAASASPPASGPAAGEGLLSLAFRAAAWVEIVDARGKVLLSRTHAGGSRAEVSGKPPFNIVIGNAAEVRLTYNGQPVDLEPHTKVAVARLTLQ